MLSTIKIRLQNIMRMWGRRVSSYLYSDITSAPSTPIVRGAQPAQGAHNTTRLNKGEIHGFLVPAVTTKPEQQKLHN